ncbi:Uncharacterized protein APZ42_017681 [Daphnia magna]|uniref:Uncharacterized protein n=1 Tax=Daphnia magna TaxID=35525 RepID=A0A164ZZN6_9CRUS|nr:Uncharacterized protein APZ42_017681 [Daphnia magna]
MLSDLPSSIDLDQNNAMDTSIKISCDFFHFCFRKRERKIATKNIWEEKEKHFLVGG